MRNKRIIEDLKKKKKSFSETENFSQLPGIYAFLYTGENFPVAGETVKKYDIVYIGKTESSQEKRNLKTHFTDGKTGSSTLRKSIGSLLFQSHNLIPIPRNTTDYDRGKYSHFKFDTNSEKIITTWMKNNLAVSFYEYPKTKMEIEKLEYDLINLTVPILNISNNPKNQFKLTLSELRKACAIAAVKYSAGNEPNLKSLINMSSSNNINKNSSGKYYDLWENRLFDITASLKDLKNTSYIQFDPEEFHKVGNRKKYSFNLEFTNGSVSNNISGTAVARDLAKVLENDEAIKKILKTGHYKFTLNKEFCLTIKSRQ